MTSSKLVFDLSSTTFMPSFMFIAALDQKVKQGGGGG